MMTAAASGGGGMQPAQSAAAAAAAAAAVAAVSAANSAATGAGARQQSSSGMQQRRGLPPPLPAFTTLSSLSSNNPFLATPGNSFGLGPASGALGAAAGVVGGGGGSKVAAANAAAAAAGAYMLSTSPSVGGCSPIFGGPSLLPVPHSPLMPNGASVDGTAFTFGNNPWMPYCNDARGGVGVGGDGGVVGANNSNNPVG